MTTTPPESYFEDLDFADAPQVVGELPGPRAKELLERQARVDSQVFS